MGMHSYINSEQFMLDFMPVRTGDYTIEWKVQEKYKKVL